jgi:multisubunit Na+/H+ antiporter MnhF subunit
MVALYMIIFALSSPANAIYLDIAISIVLLSMIGTLSIAKYVTKGEKV